jgi:cobalt-precorrin 5A hydrolase/precorrin-3B C17-methyltransferase
LGVGAERGVAAAELVALVRRTLAQAKLAPAAIACVASHEMKSDEPAIHALATELGVPARFFSSATLAAEESRLARPSELVRRLAGTPGVAEAAALAAAGPGGALIVPKTKSARATCALARSLTAIDPATLGIARGSLSVVGIGPGDPAWRTTEASAAIVAAQDVVGYGLYLDLIADLIAGKSRHESGLGHEEDRVRLALDLAVSGRRVALVSSGDAGIYGLAALAVELIERADDPAWARIDLRVCPGVSALQAAAARVGAPLGHDFCAISLSDLLTPWAEIERRLAAAGAGDFVVALYNPVSMRRRWQLARACEILARHRPTETPVVLARNLGRDGERVEIIKLCDLAAASVDMLTVVLVGSSRTRVVARPSGPLVVTPRGYAAKTIRAKRARDS